MKKAGILGLIAFSCVSFTGVINFLNELDPVPIPPSVQRLGGDSAKGFEYLINGDYVRSGVPYNLFLLGMGKDRKNLLHREGKNQNLPFDYTAVETKGEVLVAPNCMQCHAQVFNDSLIVGMGNTFINFSEGDKVNVKNFERLENMLKLTGPKKLAAAAPFIQVGKVIAPYLKTEVQGVNAADRLTAVLAAHRDPETFKWSSIASIEVPKDLIPTDVPAWWLLKKKNAMFYNGFGRGDFGRFLMASNLLTVNDTAESVEVDAHMPDVLAYIYSIQAPKYPGKIDATLAAEGEKVFTVNCSKCHGTYGENGEYPNLLIPSAVIQTDSMLLVSNFSNPQFIEWFNKSWFTKGDHPARLEPFNGYVAPPLDGVWATAPYLHNGSVPDMVGLLNSDKRPKYWSRDFEKNSYNNEKLGWDHQKLPSANWKNFYNTTLPGYSNVGHYFGDRLTEKERTAVLEYLKTL